MNGVQSGSIRDPLFYIVFDVSVKDFYQDLKTKVRRLISEKYRQVHSGKYRQGVFIQQDFRVA